MGTNSASVLAPVSDFTSPAQFNRPTYLMCSPQWYDVDYVINPWMAGNVHRPSRDVAFTQWKALYQHLLKIADVRLLHPKQGSPDMVFVGHGALVNHGVAAISSFAHAQRQTEESHLRRWLQEHGFLLWETPRETAFEGEGDALFDADGNHLWAAHGVRTCRYSHQHVADAWKTQVTSLHLIDPRFYHLDTCFAPLAGGYLLYYPGAFDGASLELIEAAYPKERRIAVTEEEATQFGCNVINIGQSLILHPAGEALKGRLTGLGFEVIETPLGEFLKSGASAKSLALRLSDVSVTHGVGV